MDFRGEKGDCLDGGDEVRLGFGGGGVARVCYGVPVKCRKR